MGTEDGEDVAMTPPKSIEQRIEKNAFEISLDHLVDADIEFYKEVQYENEIQQRQDEGEDIFKNT